MMWLHDHVDPWAPPGLVLRLLVALGIALLVYLVVREVAASDWPGSPPPQYRTCADFATQAEAQAALPLWPRLDGDRDGVACENLARGRMR